MKKITLALFLFFVSLGINAKDTLRKHIIKINYLSPLAGSCSVFYERNIAPNISINAGLGYVGPSFIISDNQTVAKGISIMPEIRFYFRKQQQQQQMQGFYISPFLRYRNLSIIARDDFAVIVNKKYIALGVGVMVGQQWIIQNRVTADIWGGLGHNFSNRTYNRSNEPYEYIMLTGMLGYAFRFGATLGVAF